MSSTMKCVSAALHRLQAVVFHQRSYTSAMCSHHASVHLLKCRRLGGIAPAPHHALRQHATQADSTPPGGGDPNNPESWIDERGFDRSMRVRSPPFLVLLSPHPLTISFCGTFLLFWMSFGTISASHTASGLWSLTFKPREL